MSRQILHVDMDAFFASVEQLDDPELRGKPVLVGGRSKRGVVAAASYEARPFGVHSAMPMMEALRRCPQAIVVSGRRGRYAQVSSQIFDVFRRYTPLVEGLSLDEAFLDVTKSQSLFGDGERVALRIKADIVEDTGLTASAGVAPCKFAAKIASDMDKPDGLFVVAGDVAAFLAPLPIERMWGVGKVAAMKLRRMGFATIGDLAKSSPERLEGLLGSWGRTVGELARGIDDREVVPQRAAKSIGSEETFETDLRAVADLERKTLAHSQLVARRLARSGLWARNVQLKVKYADFQIRTRQRRLDDYVMDTDAIFRTARALLDELPHNPLGIRLLGVSVSDLSTGSGQASLFVDEGAERREKLERATTDVADRFGDIALTRATLLEG